MTSQFHSASLSIERATDGKAAAIKDMGIDHRRFDVFVAEEFLDGANIVPGFQQVGRKAMAEGVRGDLFGEASGLGCGAHGFLHAAFVQVMPAEFLTTRVLSDVRSGKNILPAPLPASIGVFARQGIG